MKLWVEWAQQSQPRSEAGAVPGQASDRTVRTFQTEERFFSILVSCPHLDTAGGDRANQIATRVAAWLEQGSSLEMVEKSLLESLPAGEYTPVAILQILGGEQAELLECDAPPLFLARHGQLVLLPVLEEEVRGRLVRRCRFTLQDGDRLAIVSEGYIQPKGGQRCWRWSDIALSIKRLTATGGDARYLLEALLRMYERLATGQPRQGVTVIAMRVRPLQSLAVWSGPAADPARDEATVRYFMAAPGWRAICGDTTAEIAARVLGTRLEMDRRPEKGWGEVPATSRLTGVNLVTEGVVTLRKVVERVKAVHLAEELPRAEDGATRLAQLLLRADTIRFLVGMAVNPAQRDGALSWRQGVIEQLVDLLRERGQIVSVEYVDQIRMSS